MASNVIVPVSSSASSAEVASFLFSDGVGAGFVRHRDIWWNNDEFLAMVWALIKAPRKDGILMKLLYVRHTVIETELVVKYCSERLGCQAKCGAFPSDEARVTAMTFSQARRLLTSTEVLCENVVILVDGSWLETVDTEIAGGLISQSINPASCVKIIGLYNENWDDQAAERAMPFLSPLFREVGIRKLSVAFTRGSMAEADPEPTLVDKDGLVNAMVDCLGQGKHVAFFMPRRAFLRLFPLVEKSLAASRRDVVPMSTSLRSESSMNVFLGALLDIGTLLLSDRYLFHQSSPDALQVRSFIIIIDPEVGFTTIPVKRVGLIVCSHLLELQEHGQFKAELGVSVHPKMYRELGMDGLKAQRQWCRGANVKRVWMTNHVLKPTTPHPVDHSKEFALELIRGWPGKSMGEIPLNLEKRNVRSLDRTLSHMAMAGIIEPHQNGYILSKTKGAEIIELLPIVSDHGLSFDLVTLLASARHCVAHQRAKRLLIRLAVLAGQEKLFLAGLTPGLDEEGEISWDWMEEAQGQMAGPARGQMATGGIWFALGIWEKMRNDTHNFSVPMPEADPGVASGYQIGAIGTFSRDIAVQIYMLVSELELRIGLPLLAYSDQEWEQPLEIPELRDVQAQLISAFISSLAVWDREADKIWLMGSGREIQLPQSSLVFNSYDAGVDPRQEEAYLMLLHRITEDEEGALTAESAFCMGISLLRITSMVLGEAAADWLKWP